MKKLSVINGLSWILFFENLYFSIIGDDCWYWLYNFFSVMSSLNFFKVGGSKLWVICWVVFVVVWISLKRFWKDCCVLGVVFCFFSWCKFRLIILSLELILLCSFCVKCCCLFFWVLILVSSNCFLCLIFSFWVRSCWAWNLCWEK